ncbi:MAG TPA: hypothetical protein PKE45_04500, partial [Caldilineaceae bacterium]|nr:hypothetical protein [Caldilineaceae bacterium]
MKTVHTIRMLAALFVAIGLWMLTSDHVSAGAISHCAAFPPSPNSDCRSGPVSPTNWNGSLVLPPFDPSLG